MEGTNFFVVVALPLSVEGKFTYQTTPEDYTKLEIGARVAVPFGARKIYTAIVLEKNNQTPTYKTKTIVSVLDSKPILNSTQIGFFEWIADYYLCSLGEVIRHALPSAFLLQSDTYIHRLKKLSETDIEDLSDEAYLILEALESSSTLLVSEVSKILDGKPYMAILNEMLTNKLIEIEEKATPIYLPKRIKMIEPSSIFLDPSQLQKSLDELKNSPKQREAILKLYSIFSKNGQKALVLSDFKNEYQFSDSVIKELKEKSLVLISEHHKSRIVAKSTTASKQFFDANKNLIEKFRKPAVNLIQYSDEEVLLETQIALCLYYLQNKKQSLFVLKDIHKAILKKQELEEFMPNARVGIYHSKYNSNEKVDFWMTCVNNNFDIVVGTSSALFLPLENLGLIQLEDEHDSIYKNNFQKPYYNARDLAVYLSKNQNFALALYSITPSVESYQNLKLEKYNGFLIGEKSINQCEFKIIDLKFLTTQKNTKDFSDELINEIKSNLEAKKQIVIYKDRRGYSMQLECISCGYIAYCPNCDVSLTYHKKNYQLKCHYCGHSQQLYTKCPSCQNIHIKTVGSGIEQVEESLRLNFPDAQIARMDSDSMRNKFAYENLIENFSTHKIDILVGTKMVLGNLDSKHIGLVVVLKGDEILHFPNFRSWEQAYQTLAGAKFMASQNNAKFIIQTKDPQHLVYKHLQEDDYKGFVETILANRKPYNYPPWSKLILIQLHHKNQEKLYNASQQLGNILKKSIQKPYILGPESPAIERINGDYYQNILIKIPKNYSTTKLKNFIKESVDLFYSVASYKSIKIRIDVDPNRV